MMKKIKRVLKNKDIWKTSKDQLNGINMHLAKIY